MLVQKFGKIFSFFKALKVEHKIYLLSTIAIIIFAIISVIAFNSFKKMNNTSAVIIEKMSEVEKMNRLKLAIQETSALGLNILVEKDDGKVGKQRLETLKGTEERFEALHQELIKSLENDQETVKQLEKVKEQYGALTKQLRGRLITSVEKRADPDTILEVYEDFDGLTVFPVGILDELIIKFDELVSQANKDGQKAYKNVQTMSLIVLIIVVVFMLGAKFAISKVVGVIAQLAKNLANSADEVSIASQQIANSSQALSKATTQQASTLQETTASVVEISTMVNSNTDNAKKSNEISGQSVQAAERGKTVVNNMIEAIHVIDSSNSEIVQQIGETYTEIENISKIILDIGTKTKVINDIVFQTKLLSFNASVEAARAGEHGKGFAVVAEEVGKLANMSGDAALEITEMLDSSIRTVEKIVMDSKSKIGTCVNKGTEKVKDGTRIAKECEAVLNEIVASVVSVSMMINEIATASQEQSSGIVQIMEALSQLDQVSLENSSSSVQSASTAENLSRQATQLNTLVQELVQLVEGQKAEDEAA